MTALVVWTGPVYSAQVPGATVPGAKELFLGCRGDVAPPHPHCPAIGNQLMGSPSSLYQRAGLPAKPDELVLAAFSAGGSVLKRLLSMPAYRRDTTAVALFDATYIASWASKGVAPPIGGFVAYAAEVAGSGDGKMFVATASPMPNKNWPTGVQTLQAIRKAVEERTGRQFVRRADFFGVTPAPAEVFQLGNVIFAEYPAKPLGHGHTSIAGQVFEKIINPWLARRAPSVHPPGQPPPAMPVPAPESVSQAVSVALGVAIGYLLVRALRRD